MNVNDKYEKIFIRRGYIKYILPAVLSMIFGQLSPLVDAICVSSKLGDAALSAFSTVSPVYYFFNIIGVLGGMGGGIGIAKASGSGSDKRAGRLFTLAIILTTAITVLFSILFLFFVDPLLKALCATTENFGYAKEYLIILLIGMVFYVLDFAVQYILTDDNNPNLAMACGIVTGVVNMIIDYAGIYLFNQGIWVTAFGTVFGAFCGLLVSLLHFRKPDRLCHFVLEGITLDRGSVSELVKPGSPEALQYALIVFQLLIGNFVLSGNMGTSGLGNAAVIENLELIATIVIAGVSESVMPLAASYFGERNTHGLNLVKKYAFVIGILTLLPLVLSLLIYPQWLLAFFFIDDPVMKATLPASIRIMAITQMVVLINTIFVCYLSSTEEEHKANISYVIMSIVQIILTYALSSVSPENAPWYASLTGGLTALVYFIFGCGLLTPKPFEATEGSLYVSGGCTSEETVKTCIEGAGKYLTGDEYAAVREKIADPLMHLADAGKKRLFSFWVISRSRSDKSVILRYASKEDMIDEHFDECIYSEFNFTRRIMLNFGSNEEGEE